MIPLLVLLLVAAMPGWAVAEVKLDLTTSTTSSLKIDKASFDAMLKDYPDAKLRVILVPDPCLAQMEAAMKAMDRFVQGLIISNDRAHTVWQPDAQQQFNQAKERWDATRRECWKEGP